MTDYQGLVIAGAPPPPFLMNHLPLGPDGEPICYGLVERDGHYVKVHPITDLSLGRTIAKATGMHLAELVQREPENSDDRPRERPRRVLGRSTR